MFDEAVATVRSYLAAAPDDGVAHLVMAQIVLMRPEPPSTPAESRPPDQATLAMDHLRRVRPHNRRMAVAFQLARGKALDRLARLDEAEAAWIELRLATTRPPLRPVGTS